MFNRNRLRARRVFISHENGRLSIHIRRQNDHGVIVLNLLLQTTAVGFLGWIFGTGFFQTSSRMKSARDLLVLLLFSLLFCLPWLILLRAFFWAAFGVEDIAVSQGTITCKRTALWWKRKFETPVSDVAAIGVKIPWHEASGSVRFLARGQTYTIGNVLPVEANEIAEELRKAIPLSSITA